MLDEVLYKVCGGAEWDAAKRAGSYAGSADDRRDGYIHMSSRRQLPRTLSRFFAAQAGLVLLAIDGQSLGAGLRWEPAGNGDLFPHLYGPLLPASVLWERPLALAVDGLHVLPAEAG